MVKVANDNSPGRLIGDGDRKHGRVVRVRSYDLLTALQRGEHGQEVRLGGAANDERAGVRQHLRLLFVALNRLGHALAGLLKR
ncbi:hypothetical protein [Methylobacterium nodulans]|uniref:hypothetical protein n=1 Tax=Methylobacterium nodulans TaxID=114616 RepID=UPI0012EEA667|nr:hypothetical protein [Methylobacterium nodulans]